MGRRAVTSIVGHRTIRATLAARVIRYAAFSDIAFNPEKSINCQARSAAVYSALSRTGRLAEALFGRDRFLEIVSGPQVGTKPQQPDLYAGLE